MSLALSPAERDALEQWLTHLAALKGRAANTVAAYRRDVTGFLDFLARHHGGPMGLGALVALGQPDLRAWMAHERGRGVSTRSLARAL